MDFFKLKVFVEIADTGNLTQASVNLNLSQPAVSAQLRSLEDNLGYSLFHRDTKGMNLTKQGKILLGDAERILKSVNEFSVKAGALTEAGNASFSIGLNTDSRSLRIEELFALMNPDDKFYSVMQFVQTKSENFEADILSEKIHAGFFYGNSRSPDIEIINLSEVPIHIILPGTWSGNYSRPEDFSKLSDFPWIWTSRGCPFYQSTVNYFNKLDLAPRKILYIDDEMLIGSLVEKEIGCSLLAEPIASRFAEEKDLVTFPLPGFGVNLNFGYRRSLKSSPQLQYISRKIQELWNIV